jgi:hypothetical protein
MSRVFYYEILRIDLEPRKVPSERSGGPPFYWDVEFY